MSIETQNSFEYFQHGSHRMLKDINGRVIGIPGGPELEGYLVVDKVHGSHAQVCFLTARDLATQSSHVSLWHSFLKGGGSSICPQVLEISDFDGLPCCICSLPAGEPISYFINRNGVLPPEVAVRLILEFVRSIQNQVPNWSRQFAIAAESIWITRTAAQPKIVLGNLSPAKHPNPEIHNTDLGIELLKYLTGSPTKNKRFQALLVQLEAGSHTLESLERTLSGFAEANPPSNYWMGYNDPDSLVERTIAVVAASRNIQQRKEAAFQIVQRSIWPAAVTATLTLGAFLIYCLIALPTESLFHMTSQPQVEYHYVTPAQPYPVAAPAMAPRYVAPPTPVVVPAPVLPRMAQPASAPVPSVVASYTSEPRVTPRVKKLLAETGVLFKELMDEPTSEWLIPPDVEKKSKSNHLDTFSLEDERNLKLLELKKAASEAKRLNKPFLGVKIEVALLKIQPDLIDSRIRLHDYLSQIQRMQISEEEISETEVEILVEASGENSKARDILNQHFHNNRKMLN
jgi:hypothetical protein